MNNNNAPKESSNKIKIPYQASIKGIKVPLEDIKVKQTYDELRMSISLVTFEGNLYIDLTIDDNIKIEERTLLNLINKQK